MEIIIAILVIAILFVTFSYFSRKRIYKEFDRLEEWKMTIMNKPVTEELSKVKHLNMTGQTEELFESWRNRWDDILTRQLPDVEELLFDTEECTDKYRFKRAKQTLTIINDKLLDIEDQISLIYSELEELIGSQTKSVEKYSFLEERYKDLRKQLLTQRHQYGITIHNLEKELDSFVEKFHSYEEATENGNYLMARDLVLLLEEKMEDLKFKMDEIPNLLIDCQSVIPSQLAEIQSGYEELLSEGYILDHLDLENGVHKLQNSIKNLVVSLEALQVKEVHETVEKIKDDLEGLYEKVEQEVLAKHYLLKEIVPTKEELEAVLKEVELVKEETISIQESYHLTEEDMSAQLDLEKNISKLDDRYNILSNQLDEKSLAFSILKEELEDIKEQMNSLQELSSQYKMKLQALRKDEIAAREQLSQLKRLLLDSKRAVEKSNIPGLPKPLYEKIATAGEHMKVVAEQLQLKPLNMISVNTVLRDAVNSVEECTAEIQETIEQATLAERIIQYGNRYRSKDLEVHVKLSEAEQLFRKYEYSQALEEAATTLEKVEPGILRRLDGTVDKTELN